jgi:hypothetical protein
MKPLDTAIYWVEYISRHGKKTLRSPLVDVCWWKANSLDIYAFILSVVLLIFYVLKIILKKIYNLYFIVKKNSLHSVHTKSKKVQ